VKIYNIMTTKGAFKALDAVRGKDPARLVLGCIYIDDKRIAATDGSMLLTAKRDLLGSNEPIPAGPYEILGKPAAAGAMVEAAIKPFEAQYPEIERVIPKETATCAVIDLIAAVKPGREAGQQSTNAALDLYALTGQKYNIFYMDKLRALDETWTAYKPDAESGALLLKAGSGQFTAVLLPYCGRC
jgi:hypothetical protein